ncbi:GNAT family N-acetyltransferase [Aureimonas psammosilenae]|uniref:GNAT family N-acetyltransferase n=1 Tax=Aureimonas psammosilenae TaxID=2495496 RepID=UPI0012610D4B|nr:GNAT family N-acetyltransferase [Aureimonas psammosilenae]
MSAYTIRNATLADVPAIARIYEHAVLHGTATYELVPPALAEMENRFRAVTGDGYPYLVAEDADGRILGYAYGSAFRARPAYRWSVEDSVYLDPDAQGRGIGLALLTRLIELCTELGFRQMIGVIGGSDHKPSIRIHEKAGFAHLGIMEASGFKFGRWIDTVLMQLPLGQGNTTLPDEKSYPGTLFKG